jgi:hypothetical protein
LARYVFIRYKDRDFCTDFILMRTILTTICLLIYGLTRASNYGDVVFSELMLDPEPSVGLPAVEYVEICNSSALSVSLAGWSLQYGDKSYNLPSCSLAPGEYVVLCAKTSVNAFPSGISVLGMTSFPSLLNSGKLMALVSATKELICCLDYSDRWYGSSFKANGGWSLECIDLSNLSGSASNWTASKDLSGGTPGRRNSVSAVNPALDRPVCSRLYVPSPNTVEIHFSEFMQLSTLTNILNYSVSPANSIVLSATVPFPNTRVVTLQLSDTLVSETEYQLNLTGLFDVSDFDLTDTTLALGLPEKAAPGSLKLNELMFNPVSGGCDYVEFVNVGSKCIDLSDVWLTNRSPSGALNAGRQLSDKPLPCLPGSYWLLSESPDSVCVAGSFPRMPNALSLTGFPSLPDDLGTVALVTTSAEVIDEMAYSDKMQFELILNPEGVALEKIRPDAASEVGSNWVSANASVHYGTPGFKNSQYREIQYKGVKGFYTSQAWMSPNNDGRNDRICIQYELPETCAGSLRIFDLQGRLVRKLVNNEVLGISGSYSWDGMRDDETLASIGRYILIAEAFTPKGQVFRNRLVLTILF